MMLLNEHVKPLIIKYTVFSIIFFSTTVYSTLSEDATIGDLSARITELESQIGDGARTDDKNPGSRVTSEDLERLKDEIRALKDTQNKTEETNQLKDELKLLREEIKLLKEQKSKGSAPSADSERPMAKSSDTHNRSSEEQNHQEPPEDSDSSIVDEEETDAIMKLLEESGPPKGGEATQTSSKNKQDIEAIREEATKHAAETAPKLPVGDAEAQYNEAFALYDRGAYKESERAFTYFIKTYPQDPLVSKAMYWKAESCMQQKNFKNAKILFVNAYKKNPKGPKAANCLLKLGEILAQQNKVDDACTAWRKLKADFPHMTNTMKEELDTMNKQYKCGKSSGTSKKSSAKS